MTIMSSFLTALCIATVTGLLMVAVFRKPLRTMLSEVCETEARSHFWTTYLSALFVMVPVVLATLYVSFASIGGEPGNFVQRVFLFVSGGLLLSLIIVGRNIVKSVGPMVVRAGVVNAHARRAAAPDEWGTSDNGKILE